MLLSAGCAPVGERYLLAPAARQAAPAEPPERFDGLALPGGRVLRPVPADFVYARAPGGVFYGAFTGCAVDRDDMFYQGQAQGQMLGLRPLGRYPDVRPYCGFGLAADGDSLLVWGGGVRDGGGWLRPRLRAQLLLLDPERGTARRLSPPRGFTRRLERVWFSAGAGSYLLQDHRGAWWRIRLP